MRNQDWVALSDAQRGQLVSIWLLAADREGKIPKDPEVIKKLCYMDSIPDIELFIKHGFIDRGVTVTSERRQSDDTDKIQRREEKNKKGVSKVEYPEWLDMESWGEFQQHRKEIRKPLTPLAEKKAINKLKSMLNGVNQRQIIDYSISNGWTGLFSPACKPGKEERQPLGDFPDA